jgi:PAS domain S-box-containing protein
VIIQGVLIQAAPREFPPELVVGSELDYPPFALVTADNQADGFTVELWKAVAHEAGLNSVIRTGPFHKILGGFKADEIDVMINLAQSDERREFCFFAVPHVTMYGAIFTRRDNRSIQSDADLPDKALIVLNRDLPHDYAISRGWTNHLILVDDVASGLKLLSAGKADAMLIGKLVGLNTLRDLKISNVQPVGQRLDFQQKFAFAVKKDRPGASDLLAKINEGVALVKANGTYDILYEKWFGILEPRSLSLTQILKYLIPFLLVSLLASGAYVVERRLRVRTKMSVSLLNATLESTADGILAMDRRNNITAFNRKMLSLGFSPPVEGPPHSRSHSNPFQFLIDHAVNPAELAEVLEHPGLDSMTIVRLKDGRSLEVVSQPQIVDGGTNGRVWSFRDVTRREQAAQQILRFNQELEQRVHQRTQQLEVASRDLERLSYVAARTRNGVIICDPTGRIEWVNEGFERISGWRIGEVVGRKPGDFLRGPETDSSVSQQVGAAIRRGIAFQFTILNYHKSGTPYWIEADVNPVFDKAGTLVNFVSVQVDITERRRAEELLRHQSEKLADMNSRLEQALRSRDGFLAAMSHEFRTPLNGVLGLTELLLLKTAGDVTERQQNYLMRIQECGNHLLELINDILDLAKIQAGKTAIEMGDCSVREICEASVRLVEESARRKRQTLTLAYREPDLQVRADKRRIKQVLVNLLSNAVKFTREGGEIGLELGAKESEVHIDVWDTGIGIPANKISKLFQPFVQLDDSLARDYSGTGLGLALVRELVDAHGGRMEVESRVGEGSRFRVVIPNRILSETVLLPKAEPDEADTPIQTLAQLPEGLRILVAEDNRINQLALRRFLERRGAEVLIAENGRQAINMVEAQTPDIVLMDIQMSLMDGLEATRRIRELPDVGKSRVPIVALTALAMAGDRERCLNAGANEYMTKPLRLSELASLITSLVQTSPKVADPGTASIAGV